MPNGHSTPSARAMFFGSRFSVVGAAMVGAFTVDSVDAHDGYSAVKGHAGSAIVPAVLAVADMLISSGISLSGRDLISALSIEYEVSYRADFALHHSTTDYHTSGAWTAVGAAAAAAKLMNLNDEQLRHAVGIAEYHGPRSQMMRCIDHPTMLRDGVGWGAPTGITATLLAEDGFTGAPAITVEGKDVEEFWEDLGERWEILNTHYKRYPVCRWAHPAIDAVSELMQTNKIDSRDIESATISTFHNATRLAGHNPKNMDEFSYSLVFSFAIMAVRGTIGVNELQKTVLEDAEICRISNATAIVESPHYTEISTRKRWADVALKLKDGRKLQSRPYSPKGDPDDPLSTTELRAKFHQYTDGTLGEKRSRDIEEMIEHICDPVFDLEPLFNSIYSSP